MHSDRHDLTWRRWKSAVQSVNGYALQHSRIDAVVVFVAGV